MVHTPAKRVSFTAFNGLPPPVIHELRSPLTSIRGYAQLLARGARGEEQARRAHDIIIREAERLAAMLERLSQVADVAAGTARVSPVRINLQNLAFAALVQARERWPDHTIIQTPGPDSRVYADRRSLSDLTAILLENAALYSNPGSTIRLSIHSEAGRGCLAVSDQGIGIPPDELDAVFECFRRASNVGKARQAASRGLGVGLFLARAAAQRAGGEIRAESRLDHGSTFVVSLPLAA